MSHVTGTHLIFKVSKITYTTTNSLNIRTIRIRDPRDNSRLQTMQNNAFRDLTNRYRGNGVGQ